MAKGLKMARNENLSRLQQHLIINSQLKCDTQEEFFRDNMLSMKMVDENLLCKSSLFC